MKLDALLVGALAKTTFRTLAGAGLGMLVGFAVTACGAETRAEQLRPLIQPSDFVDGEFPGWTKRGGEASYHVEGDEIVGTSRAKTPNTFLCSDRLFGDFTLEFEVKVDPELNSGVQIRSQCFDKPTQVTLPDGRVSKVPAGRVHGYQVEIDPSDRAWSGGIYDEARRGWLDSPTGDAKADARAAFKPSEWNHYRVVAEGDHIRTWVNGVPVADLHDGLTPKGLIALQVHGIPNPALAGKQVRWRNMRISEPDGE